MRIITVCLCLIISFVTVVYGQNLEEEIKKANGFYQDKKYDEAISLFTSIIKYLNENKQYQLSQKIQLNIATIYLEQQRYDLAIKEFESALQKYNKPDIGTLYNLKYRYSLALYKQGNYAESIDVWKSLQSEKNITDEQKASILASLGDSYRHSEMYRLSIDNYSKSLLLYEKLNNIPKQSVILTAIGLSYNKLGEYQKAISSLEKSLKIALQLNNPQILAEANSNLGIVYFDKGDFNKAKQLLDSARQIEEKNQLVRNLGVDYNNTALVLKSVGNYKESLTFIQNAIDLAQKSSNKQDEAIALSNYALIQCILGNYNMAFDIYQKAIGIYQNIAFDEGVASCYLGLGKLHEIRDLNYLKAFEYYQKALGIYEKLENIGYQAETLNQIGRVLKKCINPSRTSQSYNALIFEEEPVLIKLSPEQAANQSISAYKKALDLGRLTMRQEVIWSALQGLGYALSEQGNIEEAIIKYKEAIDTVISIRKSDSDTVLMTDYLREKEDLFTEAINLCARIYKKTNDAKYIELQMTYQEVYNNEVIKNGIQTANITFQDSDKKKIVEELRTILDQIGKMNQLIGQSQSYLSQKKSSKSINKTELKKEIEQYKIQSTNLEKQYQAMLGKLKSAYPQDVGIFESAQKIDISQLHKNCNADTAYIQYLPTENFVGIVCITKEGIYFEKIDISYRELASLIRDEFSYDCIEVYGRTKKWPKNNFHKYTDERSGLSYSIYIMHKLYSLLIKPIQTKIDGKKRLIIATSKYLSYLPFEALTRSNNSDQPDFLIYHYNISYSRPSFWSNHTPINDKRNKQKTNSSVILAVGNPVHTNLRYLLPNLEGAENEVDQVIKTANIKGIKIAGSLIGKKATESALEKALKENPVSILYFATHGVPSAEIYYDIEKARNIIAKCNKDPKSDSCLKSLLFHYNAAFGNQSSQNWNIKNNPNEIYNTVYPEFIKLNSFYENTFQSITYLNSFLYLTDDEKYNGVLTLKKILELPNQYFTNAHLAVLSACNTAVSFSPKITKEQREEFEYSNEIQHASAQGFLPGIDQICLVDTFMKRNFKYVIGTLWFAEDDPTAIIMQKCFDSIANGESVSDSLRNAKIYYLSNKRNLKLNIIAPEHPFFWAVTSVYGCLE